MKPGMLITDLPTPALLLDAERVQRNCDRMLARASQMGVNLRPHLKTAKSADVARLATAESARCITVSTLAEMDYFAQAAFRDITYAVGVTANKIASIDAISRRHAAKITLVTDTVAAVGAISDATAAGTSSTTSPSSLAYRTCFSLKALRDALESVCRAMNSTIFPAGSKK